MASYVLFSALLSFGIANAIPVNWVRNVSPESRIVGGKSIQIEEIPYQASLQVMGYHVCGGSIISNRHILTAAHCRSYFIPLGAVRVGSSYLNEGGSVHKIVDAVVHDNFDDITLDNDIAIVTVDPPIQFSSTVQPIELYDEEDEIPEGTLGLVSGFGSIKENGMRSNKLRAVTMPVVSRERCNQVYANEGIEVTEEVICAGTEKGGKDSCQGDSGGPYVINGKLAGIVSYGLGCGYAGVPGMYTNVAHFVDWIKHCVNDNSI